MEAPPILEKKRYHDLDALRAAAMLLGILLHGVISFVGEKYWPIQDTQTPYWEVLAGVQEAGATIGMDARGIQPVQIRFHAGQRLSGAAVVLCGERIFAAMLCANAA